MASLASTSWLLRAYSDSPSPGLRLPISSKRDRRSGPAAGIGLRQPDDNVREAQRLVDAELALISARAWGAFAGTPRWLAPGRELINVGVLPLG
jgi:hypothetical protein